jgi:hypothetical protein
MKDAGFTMEGNHLVEMSKSEYCEFTSLYAAVEGRAGLPPFMDDRRNQFTTSFDFTKVFQVIKYNYLVRFRLNDLQGLLDEAREALQTWRNIDA